MYMPPEFEEVRQDVFLQTMQDIQFAALVTPSDEGLKVTHVPMFARLEDESIILECHFARGNDHWKTAGNGQETVAIFQGANSYVSPSWYASKKEHGKVVPTWAYIIVHARGKLELMDDDALLEHLNQLTDANEQKRDDPWLVSDAPERYINRLSRGIVGLRLKVGSVEGKWKINQNKSEGDIRGTEQGLRTAGANGMVLAVELQKSVNKN